MLTRRFVMSGIGSSIGAAAIAPVVCGPALSQETATVHAIKVGQAVLTTFSDGTMSMPLDWALPGRPRDEIAATYASQGQTLGDVTLQVNVALIRLPGELILVDTGAGPDFAPMRGKLADALSRNGIQPAAITKVVFTHAHPDHFWGVLDPLDGATLFPNAHHMMPAAEVDYWLKPGVETGVPDAVRGAALGTQRRLKDLGAKIETFAPGAEIVPGITALDTSGHSPGHVSLMLRSGAEALLIGGDVLIEPVISFARPAWPWGPDWNGDRAIKARLSTLDMLATDKIRLLGYHLPWPGVGRVERLASATPSYRFVAG